MAVPQELVDLIIDDLEGDTTSLRSCCLAARTFVLPAQVHLFKKIEFHPPEPTGGVPCRRFYEIIAVSPHLTALVQDLRIIMGEVKYARIPSWLVTEGTLADILPLLKLRHISIVGEPSHGKWIRPYNLEWDQLGASLQSAMVNILSSPTLDEASNLKSLSISSVFFSSRTYVHDGKYSRRWHPKLTSLFMAERGCHWFCDHFVNAQIDLSGLVTLTLAPTAFTGTWEDKLTEIAGYNRLENLTLHNSIRRCNALDEMMVTIFNVIPVNSNFETITLDAKPIPFRVESSQLQEAIDVLLAHADRLRMVQLRVITSRDEFLEWEETTRPLLHTLDERGLLVLTQLPDPFRVAT
ncbi:hypothetical protein FB45DRAFT_1108925 [Roridomyces roridus]|uniref:Uncharacterized protein n=1 Tax=Roridomyces roridus TaxID=1738132 RepID=A0AAD7B9J1_9AGAR|nr:hypothetical protein FB45DRAFT_1108925 [Roridomyces roridus]